ncbi:uncharacterized protein LOC144148523 [Haemaphysalis longicornis]
MYESYFRVIIYSIMGIFSVGVIIVVVFVAFNHRHSDAEQKAHEIASTRRVIAHKESGTGRRATGQRNPACNHPMYFRCLNNSDYNRGQYIFVARDEDSSEPGPGSCKKWQPDKVCAKDSAAHFRKEQECVKTCEKRRDKRCLALITEDFVQSCSDSPEDGPRKFWYYDRVKRKCLRWAPAIMCAYNAFRSMGHCKLVCLVPKSRRLLDPQENDAEFEE